MPVRAVLSLAAFAVTLCQATRDYSVRVDFERGGTLAPSEYALLEPVARGMLISAGSGPGEPDIGRPQPTYVYASAPGFDPKTIPRVGIGPFTASGPEAAELAAGLPEELASALAANGLPATTGTSEPFVISGTVALVRGLDVTSRQALAITRVEARVTRGGATVGVLQANLARPPAESAPDAAVIVWPNWPASGPSWDAVVVRHVRDALLRAHGGERDVVYLSIALSLPLASTTPWSGPVPGSVSAPAAH